MGSELAIEPFRESDEEELFSAFAAVVEEGGGYPQQAPVEEDAFRAAWFGSTVSVQIARLGPEFAGAYYLRPNFPGRASHIANAGYLVVEGMRGRGFGQELVLHSFAVAREHGFDAMMFNLVFESNPACRLYERLGFEQIGRVPDAVEGETARIYWRALSG